MSSADGVSPGLGQNKNVVGVFCRFALNSKDPIPLGVDILLGFHTPGVWNSFSDFVEGYITLYFLFL